MFCYQFSDFIRTDKAENPFELFDHVRIRGHCDRERNESFRLCCQI
jgi:hypothetical protein